MTLLSTTQALFWSFFRWPQTTTKIRTRHLLHALRQLFLAIRAPVLVVVLIQMAHATMRTRTCLVITTRSTQHAHRAQVGVGNQTVFARTSFTINQVQTRVKLVMRTTLAHAFVVLVIEAIDAQWKTKCEPLARFSAIFAHTSHCHFFWFFTPLIKKLRTLRKHVYLCWSRAHARITF